MAGAPAWARGLVWETRWREGKAPEPRAGSQEGAAERRPGGTPRCLSVPPRWALLTKKGYQEQDLDPQVSVITKLKGVSVTRIEELGNRLWDVADFVKPPQVGDLALLLGAGPSDTPPYCECVQGGQGASSGPRPCLGRGLAEQWPSSGGGDGQEPRPEGRVQQACIREWVEMTRWARRNAACACSVAQSCLALCDPTDCSPLGSSVHGIL